MTDLLPFELDQLESVCPVCAAVVANRRIHLTTAHPAPLVDVAAEPQEATP